MSLVWPENYREAAEHWYYVGGYGWCDLYCAAETAAGHQCARGPGHGPNGLYCKQHAKMREKYFEELQRQADAQPLVWPVTDRWRIER